jgi:hypothetical protein
MFFSWSRERFVDIIEKGEKSATRYNEERHLKFPGVWRSAAEEARMRGILERCVAERLPDGGGGDRGYRAGRRGFLKHGVLSLQRHAFLQALPLYWTTIFPVIIGCTEQ